MVKVYSPDGKTPVVQIESAKRRRPIDENMGYKFKALEPVGGIAKIASAVYSEYDDAQRRSKEEQQIAAIADALEGQGYSNLAHLARAGGGKEALTAAANRSYEAQKYGRNREDKEADAEAAFARQVRMERIKAQIKKELGPSAKDYEVVVKNDPVTGEQKIFRIHAPTREVIQLDQSGKPVAAAPAAAAAAPQQEQLVPGASGPGPRISPEDQTAPAAEAAPTATPQAAPPQRVAEASPAPGNGIPGDVHLPTLSKEKAKYIAKAPEREAEQKALAEKNATRLAEVNKTLENVSLIASRIQPNDRLWGIPGTEVLPEEGVGPLAWAAGFIGGTDSSEISGLLKQPEAFFTFDKLMDLKNSSTTGASGLGQITHPELILLKNSFDALDQYKFMPDTYRMKLGAIQEQLQVIKAKLTGNWSEEKEKIWQSRFEHLGGKWNGTEEDLRRAFGMKPEQAKGEKEAAPAAPKERVWDVENKRWVEQ